MATLQQLMAQITGIQQRGVNLVDPMTSMQQAQIALLAQLVADVTALQGDKPGESTAGAVSMADVEQYFAKAIAALPPSVTPDHVQEMVTEAVSAAFGKLESAVAQPEVANTGSGAAPVAPMDSPASNSASLTPDAAGTAPNATSAQVAS